LEPKIFLHPISGESSSRLNSNNAVISKNSLFTESRWQVHNKYTAIESEKKSTKFNKLV